MKGQVDYKMNKRIGNGVAASVILGYTTNNFNLSNTIRYYSARYNQGFRNRAINYQFDQLYPLKNYFRNVAQWAFFTDYQGSSLFNYAVLLKHKLPIAKKISLNTNLDLNVVYDFDNKRTYAFPAYEVLFNLFYVSAIKFEIGVTNRHMALNSYYQGVSLSKMPFISYGFRLDLDRLDRPSRFSKP